MTEPASGQVSACRILPVPTPCSQRVAVVGRPRCQAAFFRFGGMVCMHPDTLTGSRLTVEDAARPSGVPERAKPSPLKDGRLWSKLVTKNKAKTR
jgi:hypothetical protein